MGLAARGSWGFFDNRTKGGQMCSQSRPGMPSPTLPTLLASGDGEENEVAAAAAAAATAAAYSLVSSPEASSSISSEMPAAGCEDGVEVEPRKGGCEDGEEEEDLICRRTRAKYSLANFTLDELETFLQETDDEEDFQKADEEEEYQKFLAGVLAGEDESDATGKEAEEEEEDENDADFEVELEELLESDRDLDGKGEEEGDIGGAKASSGRDRRRPDTRQNRRRRTLGRPREKPLGQAVIPLRPILPSWVPAPSLAPGIVVEEGRCGGLWPGLGLAPQPIVVSSFTPHQIGQLHCLIHEHAQLLIQVYTLCAFEPSKESVASDVKRLILELNGFRNAALSRRTIPYPVDSFRPPHIHPSSVVREAPNNTLVTAEQVPPTWIPVVGSSITSVTDVAPLECVGRYLSDVGNAARDYMQRYLGAEKDRDQFELEPLFLLPRVSATGEANNLTAQSSPASHLEQPSLTKKSCASALVECSKKQSIALAPRAIVKLSQQFFHMFNPALFPHKPPSGAFSNRPLFTDAEDELLALGLMEYNNDWKSIHERFLPCKTKHQIFVRAKNRCSSKAPENPIKAARRMKVAPLTEKEKALICEGLKVYKLDWASLRKCYLPHRDPALLPRQWREAIGIQKSYKRDGLAREKRRLYEIERRKLRKASFQNGMVREVDAAGYIDDSTDEHVNEDDASFVHEAFLADDTSEYSRLASSEIPICISKANLPPSRMFPEVGNAPKNSDQSSNPNPGVAATKRSHFSHVERNSSLCLASNLQLSDQTSNGLPKPLQPYRTLKSNATQLVKLAPNLPPVNLPPSVRVISQSSLPVADCPVGKGKGSSSASSLQKHHIQIPRLTTDQSIEETGNESDLRMHPLLFQASEHGLSQHFPLKYGSTSASTLNFFPSCSFQSVRAGSHGGHQGTKGLLGSSAGERLYPTNMLKRHASKLSSLDFHPLLQSIETSTKNNQMPTLSLADSSLLLDKTSSLSRTEDGRSANEKLLTTASGKGNEFDLNVQLTSCSLMDETVQSRKENEPNGFSLDSVNLNMNQLYNGDCAMKTTPADGFADQIVMEQEELSDSDEEVFENVEFECEEMADSEGEELDFEDVRDKQVEDHTITENRDANSTGKAFNGTGEICIDGHNFPLLESKSVPRCKKTANHTKACLNSLNHGSHTERKRKRESKACKAERKSSPKKVQSCPHRSSGRKPNKKTEMQEAPSVNADCSTAAPKRKPMTRSMRVFENQETR